MRTVLWVLTLILIVVMPTQSGFYVGGTKKMVVREVQVAGADGSVRAVTRTAEKREGGVHVSYGDAWLALVFLIWAGYVLVTVRVFEVRLPAFAVFLLLAVVLASAVHARSWGSGLREAAQLGAYFVGGWLIFANCINTRVRLRAAAGLFTLVVAGIVVIALVQYHAAVEGSAFLVRGTFGNRNVLGSFLAISLPFVFAIGLYEKKVWQQFALMLTVAFGAAVTLSGGALIALAAALLFVAALKSGKALVAVLVAILLAMTLLPGMMPMARHSDVVVSSVAPYLGDSFLSAKKQGGEPEVAARYKGWYAATQAVRRDLHWPFLGAGPGRFNERIETEYGFVPKPSGDTDSVADFNISAPEPDSFSTYFVAAVEYGPLGLLAVVWIGMLFLGRNLRRRFRESDEFGKALALGAAGAVVGAALAAVFSDVLVRGVALPFIFVALSGILWPKE